VVIGGLGISLKPG